MPTGKVKFYREDSGYGVVEPIRPEEIIGPQAYIENNCLIRKMVTPRGGRVAAHRLIRFPTVGASSC